MSILLLLLLTTPLSNADSVDESIVRDCFVNQTIECFPSQKSQNKSTCQKYCKKKMKLTEIGSQINSNHKEWTEYECSWYFYSTPAVDQENKYLYLKMNQFFLNPQFDYIYIFNGTSSNSPLIAALTGEIKNNTVFILRHLNVNPTIYILFKRNSNRQSSVSNFSIEYLLSSDEINQTLFTSSKSSEYSTPQLFPNCIQNRIDRTYDYNLDTLNSKRALHSIILINQTKFFIIGGYSFDFLTLAMNEFYELDEYMDNDFNFIISYDLINDKLEKLVVNKNISTPLKRYSFSSIYDPASQRIIIFGGLLINTVFNQSIKNVNKESLNVDYILTLDNPSYRHISDEIWSFDLNAKKWSLLNNLFSNTSERVPIGVCGHSSILYRDTMLTFFGFSRFFGSLTLIQEFNLTSNTWSIRNLTNVPLFDELKSNFPIGFRHTSVLDERTNLIYIYGGLIVSESYFEEEIPIVSRFLLVYNPDSHSMKQLKESSIASFAHSASIFADCIYFFAGSVLNSSTGLIRTSKRIRIYNISENNWYNDGPTDSYSSLMTNKDRYGHVSIVLNSSFCIQGGFNGIFLNDLFCLNLSCFNSSRNESAMTTSSHSVHMDATFLQFYPNCGLYIECYSCQFNPNCIWYQDQCVASSVFQVTNGQNSDIQYLVEKKTCKKLCYKEQSCLNCTQNSECMWCDHNNICLQKEQFKLIYTFGQCFEYINETSACKKYDTTPLSLANKTRDLVIKTNIFGCLDYKNCSSCVEREGCGWCSLDNNTMGYGVCMDAITNLNNDYTSKSYCKEPNWHFDSCPLCECNGHSICNYNLSRCLSCMNSTSGSRCEKCADGYFGNALNNGICNKCECNSQANSCDPNDGRCFCFTKGVTGVSCSSCEYPRYSGNPSEPNGTCFYDLTIDYQFTFNLNKETDKYYNQIHFSNNPTRFDDDIDMTIKCIKHADGLFNVTYILWYDYDLPHLSTMLPPSTNTTISLSSFHTNEIQLLNSINCTSNEYKYTFTSKDDSYYLSNSDSLANMKNIKNRTFFVYVYNFKTPIVIQISFTHKTRIQLLHFFITFFGCFLTLLAIAFILWKSKQRYDRYRRQRRLIIEMKQMASRPFSKLYIDLNSNDTQNENTIKNQELVMPVAIQPLINNKTAVLTVLLQLPDGSGALGSQTNEGYENDCFQHSPFVFGSTLVHYDPNELSEKLDVGDVENSDKTIIVDIK